MTGLSIEKEKEKREKQEVEQKQCKMCKGFFSADLISHNRCPECNKIFKEWQNGRKKTPEEKKKFKGIRAHYKIASYKKVYSVYQYDQQKYSEIWQKVKKLSLKYGKEIFDRTNPYRVLKNCYIRVGGNLVHLKDEKHIFRYPTLHNLSILIAKTLTQKHGLEMDVQTIEYLKKKTGIIYYNDETEPMAEYEKAQRMPLKERIIVAIRLYRLLNIDEFTIEKASSLAPQIDVKFSKETGKLLNPENITQNTKTKGEIEKPFKDWERIKELYIMGYNVKKLAQRFDIPVTTLREKIVKENWGNRKGTELFINNELERMKMQNDKRNSSESIGLSERTRNAKENQKENIQDDTQENKNKERAVTLMLTIEEEEKILQFLKKIRYKEYTFKLNEEEFLLINQTLNLLRKNENTLNLPQG